MKVRISPGEGLVARSGDGLMVILPGGDAASASALAGILERVCASSTAPGRTLARQLAGLILEASEGSIPPFATAAPAEDGWAVMVFGAAEARTDDGARLSGREAATWVDRVVPARFTWLRLGADSAGTDQLDRRSHLDAGIVPGSGLLLELASAPVELASAPPAPAPPPAPARAPVPPAAPAPPPPAAPAPPPPAAEFQVFPLDPPEPEAASRQPLPIPDPQPEGEDRAAPGGIIVDGILCVNGHFNHPKALYCAVDGVSTVHRTRTPVKGPRPSLGVIVADDGQTYSLDSNYVIGREPELDPGIHTAGMRPLRLDDPALSVSRVHAEIHLENWDVYVVDRGSANGTFLAEGERSEWVRLTAGQSQLVGPGTRIAFGQRIVTYNTHHQIA